ncbi:MAG: DUF4935 domain-containing protein, partial [Armatimonadetes bacterium]|nr:DUF4935 domain-containing protein [Armatimonadota bacterium]
IMKETFPGYYRPTETEFRDLWDDCLFVLDANVLLNLYQYSVATREELLRLLRELSDRLWLPHQAALEYQRNRLAKIDELVQLYEERRDNLEGHLKEVDDQLRPGARHPFVKAELLDRMTTIVHEIDEELAEKQEECRAFLDDDPVRPDITVFLDGRVGSPYADSRQREIYKEGKQRYEERTPPGYADSKKGPPNQYGDLVLWYQVIDEAEEQNKPVILVTDDRKDDWWWRHQGETVGPRPELIQEMKSKAGVSFYMYSTDQFMKYASEYVEQQVEQEAIDEVRSIRELAEQDERIARAGLFSTDESTVGTLETILRKKIPDLADIARLEGRLERYRAVINAFAIPPEPGMYPVPFPGAEELLSIISSIQYWLEQMRDSAREARMLMNMLMHETYDTGTERATLVQRLAHAADQLEPFSDMVEQVDTIRREVDLWSTDRRRRGPYDEEQPLDDT